MYINLTIHFVDSVPDRSIVLVLQQCCVVAANKAAAGTAHCEFSEYH